MLKIVVLLCISVIYARDNYSPQGALSGFAQKLREEVNRNDRSRFEHSFSSPQQTAPILDMAGGQLFSDPRARNSFNVEAVPGAQFWGTRGPHQFVKGQLNVNVYNPTQHRQTEQRFSVILGHTERNGPTDWKVNSITGTGLFGK